MTINPTLAPTFAPANPGFWVLVEEVPGDSVLPNASFFGASIAVFGSQLAMVGATGGNGSVVILERGATNPSAQFVPTQTLSGRQANSQFGTSVSVIGDVAVVGANNEGMTILRASCASIDQCDVLCV